MGGAEAPRKGRRPRGEKVSKTGALIPLRAVFFDAAATLFRPSPSVGALYARSAAKYGCRVSEAWVEARFRAAWRRRRVRPEEALHVGDTYREDFLGARRGNAPSGVRRVRSLSGLVEIIDRISRARRKKSYHNL